jgi:hypothetical protein
MIYHSIVVDVPYQFPFDGDFESRTLTWAGEFVRPILARRLHEAYWFSFYGPYGKLRLLIDESKLERLQPTIEAMLLTQRMSRQLDENGQLVERNLTLEEDLGHPRFCGRNCSREKRHLRAKLVLSFLTAVCDLLLDSLHRFEGRWELEPTGDALQNPEGSSFQSLHHLFCQITHVPTLVFEYAFGGVKGIESRQGVWNLEKFHNATATIGPIAHRVRF